jgi:hypothetical protein
LPYVGNIPAESYAAFNVQHFTTSATTSYTLDHAVANELDIRLVINNVIQQPGSGKAYTASGTTLTLSAATSGTDTMYCVYTGKAVQTVNPPAGSVGTSQLADDAVTTVKINDDAVNAAKLSSTAVDNTNTNSTLITAQTAKTSLVDADEFLISDSEASGALKKVDLSDLPFSWKLLKTGSVSSGDGYATLTSVFTSTYKIYKIFFYDWNTSIDAAPYLQWVTGASTVESGSNTYFYAGVGYNTSGGGSNWSGNDTQFQIAGETIRHDSDEQFAWEGTLYNPAGTTLKKRLVFAGGGRRTGNYTFSANGSGEWNSTTAITGLKVRPSGGTFDSLSWRIYGIAK